MAGGGHGPAAVLRGVALALVVVAGVAVLAGCGGAPSSQPPSSEPPSSEPASAPPSTGTPTATAVPVDWSGGRDAPGMDVGIPSPPGWYEAAIGPRPTERVLYLTFDDGPAPPYTDALLDLLADAGARATFFLVGRVAETEPALVRRIADEGHALGNHSWSHADLLTLSRAGVRAELADTQEALLELGGPCMRPPYGLIDETVADVASRLGLTPVMWTGHAGDWNVRPVGELVRRMREATEPGAVLLLHDGGGPRQNTVAAVERLLPWWAAQGYRLEPLPPCESGGAP